MEKYEEALSDVNKILSGELLRTGFTKEGLVMSHKLRAHIYADLKRYDESIQDATEILKYVLQFCYTYLPLLRHEKTSENFVFRGNLYHENNNMEEARRDIDTADEMGADDSDFWLSKALVCIFCCV